MIPAKHAPRASLAFKLALLKEIAELPALDLPQRKYQTPRDFEQKACPRQRSFRQFFIKDLDHDQPTILLTNDHSATAD
jgi:hypothetical protein